MNLSDLKTKLNNAFDTEKIHYIFHEDRKTLEKFDLWDVSFDSLVYSHPSTVNTKKYCIREESDKIEVWLGTYENIDNENLATEDMSLIFSSEDIDPIVGYMCALFSVKDEIKQGEQMQSKIEEPKFYIDSEASLNPKSIAKYLKGCFEEDQGSIGIEGYKLSSFNLRVIIDSAEPIQDNDTNYEMGISVQLISDSEYVQYEYVDLGELVDSVCNKKLKGYDFFVCSQCGYPECAGYVSTVKSKYIHDKNLIRWTVRDPLTKPQVLDNEKWIVDNKHKYRHIFFDAKEYEKTIFRTHGIVTHLREHFSDNGYFISCNC